MTRNPRFSEPRTVRPWTARLPGLRIPLAAWGPFLLGFGSLARGLTLDRPVSAGGAWSWKAAEALNFILGDSPAARWSVFGGAGLVSMGLGWALVSRVRGAPTLLTVLAAADLGLCALLGDRANVLIHAVVILLAWVPIPNPPGAVSSAPQTDRP